MFLQVLLSLWDKVSEVALGKGVNAFEIFIDTAKFHFLAIVSFSTFAIYSLEM